MAREVGGGHRGHSTRGLRGLRRDWSPTIPRLHALFPYACRGTALSHICVSLAEEMSDEVEVRVQCHSIEVGAQPPTTVVHAAAPSWLLPWLWRANRVVPLFPALTIRRFLRAVAPDDVAWLWPGRVNAAARELRRRGVRTVVEAVNTHQATSRPILLAEFARLGWAPVGVPSESDVADESALYELADHVFCPSELVARSMVTAGVPESKLLRTSYGWSPERVDSSAAIGGPPSSRPFTALFLGTVCLRKGAHLLAAAWRDAAIDGRLRLVGALAPEFAGEREHALDGRGVERLGHRRDVAALLREADVFAFPTLEEGSALVVYEAAAAGLAIVTTPMGAGGVLRAGVDAVVLDPLDHDAWVATLRELAADGARRAELGRSARARVADFTWRDVARRRLAMLREAGADLPRAAAR